MVNCLLCPSLCNSSELTECLSLLGARVIFHSTRGPDYRALSAVEKQRLVWENIRLFTDTDTGCLNIDFF